MKRLREILSVIGAIVVIIVLAALLSRGVIVLSDVSAALAAVLVAAIFGILGWGFEPRIKQIVRGKSGETKEKPIQVEVKYPEPSPVLDLRPLPHYKGYGLPLKVEILPDLPDGQHQATATNVGASTAEYNLLEISQKLEAWKGSINQPMNELIVKFGVIRVHCISGDALNCRAQVKVRIIEMYGQIRPTNFVDWGYLNWFSVAIKRDIQQNKFDEIYPAKHLGLNKYLKNTSVDLHEGDEKDLLVFYMIKDLPNVFLCTDIETAHAGSVFSSGQTLKFEVEIGLTAQRYPKNIWTFFVTVEDFDDFKIERG